MGNHGKEDKQFQVCEICTISYSHLSVRYDDDTAGQRDHVKWSVGGNTVLPYTRFQRTYEGTGELIDILQKYLGIFACSYKMNAPDFRR